MRALIVVLLVCGLSAAFASPTVTSEEIEVPKETPELPTEPEVVEEEPAVEVEELEHEPIDHPCSSHVCERGEECKLDEEETPFCVCKQQCPEYAYPVCSTSNVTFNNECELDRQQCLCREGQEGCEVEEHASLTLDYYSDCRELRECYEHEMEQFPVRMREWLFIVMEELAKRKELPKSFEGWAKMAEVEEKHWLLPVVWKFCELDSDPEDRRVRRAELLHLSASLKAMENCISPFLDTCDADDNDQITLHEWGQCLGMSEDEATKFENHCIAIHSKEN